MALLSSIQFGDNDSKRYTREYLVTDYRVHFQRHHNRLDPDSTAKCERIEVTIVVPGKADQNLYDWYINQSAQSGRLVFQVSSPLTAMQNEEREVCFENALCYSLAEDYRIDTDSLRKLRLKFCADTVTVNDISFQLLK